MPSCRLWGWSMTIWSTASAMRTVRGSAKPGIPADGAGAGSATSMAADAVGPPARPARPLAARYRNRRHRPWLGPRGALERANAGAGDLFGGAAFGAGRRYRRRAAAG